jgi:hypothetical protein
MDYVLLIYSAENRLRTDEERSSNMKAYVEFSRDLAASGRMGDAAPLDPITTATTVRIRGGKRVVTDGPFAETREQLGGYYVVKTKDVDEACDIAEKIPDAHGGSIEVRPVLDLGPAGVDQGSPAKSASDDKEYILLIHEDENVWKDFGDKARSEMFERYGHFTRSIIEKGQYVAGAPLVSASKAKTVRVPADKRIITDGPFAETREQLGGYYRVRAANLDVALDIAARIPAAETGSIEVRPVMDLTGKM